MTLEQTQAGLVGDWTSIAPEVRPSAAKNPDGTLKPFYLTRSFKYAAGSRFELEIVNSADANGKVPLARIFIRGHMLWRGPHPIAAGAQKVDFVADEGYEVTPLIQGFADVLNQIAGKGYDAWKVSGTQSVFGKSFAPFGLVEVELHEVAALDETERRERLAEHALRAAHLPSVVTLARDLVQHVGEALDERRDLVAFVGHEVTPLIQGFADVLNQIAGKGYDAWKVSGTQSVFGKSFAPFGLVEGRNFMEFDLVYLSHDLLFWGARNIDGRGFDKEENRPTNLQIPLIRK